MALIVSMELELDRKELARANYDRQYCAGHHTGNSILHPDASCCPRSRRCPYCHLPDKGSYKGKRRTLATLMREGAGMENEAAHPST